MNSSLFFGILKKIKNTSYLERNNVSDIKPAQANREMEETM